MSKLNKKNENLSNKLTKDFPADLTKAEILMASQDIERCSLPCVVVVLQIKTPRHHYMPTCLKAPTSKP